MPPGLELRVAVPEDEPVLRAMLSLAFAWDRPAGAQELDDLPEVGERYVAGFGRPGARGVLAVRDDLVAGAAWYRLLAGRSGVTVTWPTTSRS